MIDTVNGIGSTVNAKRYIYVYQRRLLYVRENSILLSEIRFLLTQP
jgi:hypothetical protein